MRKAYRIATNILFILLAIIAVVTALSVLGFPRQLRLFVVQSGSMEPTIKRGSLVMVQPQKQYQKDDIITFKSHPEADIKNPSLLITHRIVDIKDDKGGVFFTTKGDANKSPDMETRPVGSVLGRVVSTIPYLGFPVGFAKTQTGFILLIVIPATIIVYSELLNIKKEIQKILASRKAKKEKNEQEA